MITTSALGSGSGEKVAGQKLRRSATPNRRDVRVEHWRHLRQVEAAAPQVVWAARSRREGALGRPQSMKVR